MIQNRGRRSNLRQRDQNKGKGIKTKARSKQRQDQNKGNEIKAKARSKEALCLLGLWGWEEIRIPCPTRHLSCWLSPGPSLDSSHAENTFSLGLELSEIFRFKLFAIVYPFSRLQRFLPLCLRCFWQAEKGWRHRAWQHSAWNARTIWWHMLGNPSSTDVKTCL